MLQSCNIKMDSHVTRFTAKLCQEIKGLESRVVDNKVTVFFTETTNSLILENVLPIDE